MSNIRQRFHELHTSGFFIMPNPWDVGSAKLLASLGFPALATTSSGHAASLGKHDQHVTRDELVEHVGMITAAVDVPINVDAERLFSDSLDGIAESVHLLAGAGAAGISIEDFDPGNGAIDSIDVATARVAAAATAAHAQGVLLTARAENHIHGITDLEDTIARLSAYRDAGADCLYAPGLVDLGDIARVVAIGLPVNVLMFPNSATTAQLAGIGVRRVSTGGALAWAAYGGLMRAARELLIDGTTGYFADGLQRTDRAAFD